MSRTDRRPPGAAGRRCRYGTHASQYVDVTFPRPAASPPPIAVVIHGGYWRAAVDASLGAPLAGDLAARGWAAVNVEYRRVGDGGGWPATFTDVAAALDLLEPLAARWNWDTSRIVLMGHSAGGHLAAWAAGRHTRIPVAGVVSQAGVLDLHAAESLGLSRGAARELMGAVSSERQREFDAADPSRMVPLPVPVRCVHARADVDVPFSQSEDFVRRSTRAGADASLTEAAGDHFTLIDPHHSDWRLCVAAAGELVAGTHGRATPHCD